MRLVDFLVSGVRGAENGTAEFIIRGTSSSAAALLYNDFEGSTQPGTNIITLDSNGAAEVYTSGYVNVVIKNSGGATLRTVTVGDTSSALEVKSDSFTGTDYFSAFTDVNQPITLQAVLNKWNDSAGTSDWKVLVGGVATNLSSAIAGFSGIFFNVKDPQYGAVGDGVTNDTAAFSAAIAAASTGIIFVPPGRYVVSAGFAFSGNRFIFGSGPESSVIVFSGTTLFTMSATSGNQRLESIGIETSAAGISPIIDITEENKTVTFSNCLFNSAASNTAECVRINVDPGKTQVNFLNCRFSVSAASRGAVVNVASDGEAFTNVIGCKFTMPVNFGTTANSACLKGPNFNVAGCFFDASAVTAGSYKVIYFTSNDTAGKYIGSVTGCTFQDGGSSGSAIYLGAIAADCDFSESDNVFLGFTAPTSLTSTGTVYTLTGAASQLGGRVHIGSRKSRSLHLTKSDNGTMTGIVAANIYDTIVINYTFNGGGSVSVDSVIPNQDTLVVVLNNSVATQTINFLSTGTTNPLISESTVAVGGRAIALFRSYIEVAGSNASICLTSKQTNT